MSWRSHTLAFVTGLALLPAAVGGVAACSALTGDVTSDAPRQSTSAPLPSAPTAPPTVTASPVPTASQTPIPTSVPTVTVTAPPKNVEECLQLGDTARALYGSHAEYMKVRKGYDDLLSEARGAIATGDQKRLAEIQEEWNAIREAESAPLAEIVDHQDAVRKNMEFCNR